jgi:hypothetical protein
MKLENENYVGGVYNNNSQNVILLLKMGFFCGTLYFHFAVLRDSVEPNLEKLTTDGNVKLPLRACTRSVG